MITFVKNILAILAKLTLVRFQPKVVAITGSVGKTSTRAAVENVLKSTYTVRGPTSNYNNEIGVPLTILGFQSPGKNPLGWIWIFLVSLVKLIYTHYPKVLVLELGADRPGDIEYLVNLIGRIDVAVLTDIGLSHLEFFKGPENLAREKTTLIKKLSKDATAVLNLDNPKIFAAKSETKAQVLGYGFGSNAEVQASDFHVIQSDGHWGANFKVHHKGTVVPFFLPLALGAPAVYAALAACSVGLRFNVNLVKASEGLKKFAPPPGRLHWLSGIKHTSIIDDTYNSSPDSSMAALAALDKIGQKRKLLAFGSMAELGSQTASGHRQVAETIAKSGINLVFLVGEHARIIEEELSKHNFAGKVSWFATADEARIPIQDALEEGDTILVKGSQSARMEKIVKEIMAEPLRAPELLVRQSLDWLNKP
ncbi:MAG: hypothetical protein A2660_00480 [Candidatus Doudnabacteria bacterium RIFCSPHIGHO2_01_FULL_45_18]|uniref:UDP-N-acetylmuramoyl-tripeptide--D-alanyl-D-alanine ligase n=1 Tax=Candidatus Doudnabacteria bacterium RIFCSPHIGHO2_01_FULL_45_18 TaxID=1817823 RepID=A0A1F5NQF0_9BACT|nr:MAG: hypothetical protein A2660_00480 [Candidatus Doudnabacteria bacterium RIFCSPHIGHO2_01_FULL_45_18]